MSKYTKHTIDVKLIGCKYYFDGILSRREICKKYGIYFNEFMWKSMIYKFIIRYMQLMIIYDFMRQNDLRIDIRVKHF